ncbi:MAG: hypothetical protein Q9178_003875 [Gyalolechia marmorata]
MPETKKRTKEKQDLGLAKRLKVASHQKAVRHLERDLYDLERCRDELQATKDGLKQERAKVKDLQGQKKQLNVEIATNEEKMRNMRGLNEDLKEELLKHQPSVQVVDSHIRDQYNLLHENLSSWVDTQVMRFDDQCEHPQDHVFRHGDVPEFLGFLGAGHRFGGQYLVESEVHLRLHKSLFNNNKLFFALDESENIFLRTAEDGLKDLDPPRDASKVQYLRSEILKGFTASRLFQARRDEWMSHTGMDILQQAEAILPELPDSDRKEIFKSRILDVAFDLAIAMKTSATRYNFSEPMTQKLQFKNTPLRSYQLGCSTLINIATRSKLKKDKAFTDDDAIIAQQVLLVAPGLVRDSGESIKPYRLTQDVVCVTVGRTMRKERGNLQHNSSDSFVLQSGTAAECSGETKFFKAPLVVSSDKLSTVVDVSSDSEECIATEGEENNPGIFDDDPEFFSIGTNHWQPKRKTKDRHASSAADADELERVKIESCLDRPQRKRKAPNFLAEGKGDPNVARDLDVDSDTHSVEPEQQGHAASMGSGTFQFWPN